MNKSETQVYISNIENGRMNPVRGREGSSHTSSLRDRQRPSASNGMNPTLSILEKIAKALGISSSELLK